MAKDNKVLWIFGIVVVGYLVMQSGILGGNKTTTIVNPPAQLPATGCAIAPSLSVAGLDFNQPNSAVTPGSVTYLVNGAQVGNYSAPVQGDVVTMFSDPAGAYLADAQTKTIACGPNAVNFKFKVYANASVIVRDDPAAGSAAGYSALTNSVTGGAVNGSAAPAGGVRNYNFIYTGTGLKATGKIFALIEAPTGSKGNITTMSMICNGQALPPVQIPNGMTTTNTNAYVIGVEIPELNNGAVTTCTLQVQAAANKIVTGGYRTSYFAEQRFVDDDGATIKEGTYTSQFNTAKYQDTYTNNFFVA